LKKIAILLIFIISIFLGACVAEEAKEVQKEEKIIVENEIEEIKNNENNLTMMVNKEMFDTEITEKGIKVLALKDTDKQEPEASIEVQVYQGKSIEEIIDEKLKEYNEYKLVEEKNTDSTLLVGKKDFPYIPSLKIDIKQKENVILVIIEKMHLEVEEAQKNKFIEIRKTIKIED
jgi:thioredoxin-related protein